MLSSLTTLVKNYIHVYIVLKRYNRLCKYLWCMVTSSDDRNTKLYKQHVVVGATFICQGLLSASLRNTQCIIYSYACTQQCIEPITEIGNPDTYITSPLFSKSVWPWQTYGLTLQTYTMYFIVSDTNAYKVTCNAMSLEMSQMSYSTWKLMPERDKPNKSTFTQFDQILWSDMYLILHTYSWIILPHI